MFRAWKYTILSHYSSLSGKGLMNEKHRSCDNLSLITLSFFRAPCNLTEGPLRRNLGPLNEGGLGLLSSEPGLVQRQSTSIYLVRILGVRIIELAHPVCQTNRASVDCYRLARSHMRY